MTEPATQTTDRNPPTAEPSRATPPAELQSAPVTPPPETPAEPAGSNIDLGRICWLLIVLGCAIAVLILLLKREWGYASVTGAVAISAAINLL